MVCLVQCRPVLVLAILLGVLYTTPITSSLASQGKPNYIYRICIHIRTLTDARDPIIHMY